MLTNPCRIDRLLFILQGRPASRWATHLIELHPPSVLRLPTADIVLHRLCAAKASPLTAAKGTSVVPVLNQYRRIGCSPDKHPDTGTMAPASDDDSRDSVHGRCLCISV